MARQSNADRLADVHARAVEGFDKVGGPQDDVRQNCLQDRRFAYVDGAQWEGSLSQQFENRPRFQVNKVLDSLTRIFSEYRNNRVTVDFRPKDDATSSEDADTLDGLYRADENDSNAQEAYDNAFDEGTAGGMGAWRLRAKYEDDDDEDDERQRICFEPIFDADVSVFFDLDAKRQDKADATRCWVLYSMTHDDFEAKYDKSPASFNTTTRLTQFDWYSPEVIYVAEYYEVESRKRKVHFFRLPATGAEIKVRGDELEGDEGEQYRQDLEAQGYIEARQKTVTERVVHKYIIDGAQVLDDCGIIAGKYIPIIPFYGKRMFIDNKERFFGHTRPFKDPQRIYNMEVSALAELAATFGEQVPIFTPEQVQGLEHIWANKNIKKPPYLLVNPITAPDGSTSPSGPIAYTQPPQLPPALQGLIQVAQNDIAELGGGQQNGDQIVSNISAKAVEMIQTRLDMKTFLYTDNFKKAMRHCGVVWLSMAKDLYDEAGRKMRTIGVDGTEGMVELMEPATDNSGQTINKNDFGSGKFDVITDVGPAFTSKRDQTVRALIGMLQFVDDPQTKAAIVGIILQNMDGEGLDDLRTWVRKQLVLNGVVKPNDDEQQMLAQAQQSMQQPSAQDQFLMASAQNQVANASKAQSEIVKNLASAEQSRATAAKADADAAKTIAALQADVTQIATSVQALMQALAPQLPAPPVSPPQENSHHMEITEQ